MPSQLCKFCCCSLKSLKFKLWHFFNMPKDICLIYWDFKWFVDGTRYWTVSAKYVTLQNSACCKISRLWESHNIISLSHKRRGEGSRSCVIGGRKYSHVSRVLLAFCSCAPAFCSPKKARGPAFLHFYSAEIEFLSKKRSQGGATSAWDTDFDWKWKPGGATSFSLADFRSKRKRCGATSLQQLSYGAILEIQHNVT